MQPLYERIRNGDIDPSFVVSHTMPLSEAPDGYRMFRDKQDECNKIVLKPCPDPPGVPGWGRDDARVAERPVGVRGTTVPRAGPQRSSDGMGVERAGPARTRRAPCSTPSPSWTWSATPRWCGSPR